MKSLIVLVVGLLAVGCGKPEQPVNTYENKKRVGFLSHRTETKPVKELTPTDQNTTKAEPVTELTPEQKQKALMDSVLGEYEYKNKYGVTYKYVLLENGIVEWGSKGKKEDEFKWKRANEEIHVNYGGGFIKIYRINTDKSITMIANIVSGKRTDRTSSNSRTTYKKIK